MVVGGVRFQHKYNVNKRRRNADAGADDNDGRRRESFVGPTSWSYRLCRHPNYLGEILFWSGLFATGGTSFGGSVTAWACGTMGLGGILSIMFGASSRLDKAQEEKYGGQAKFDEWKDSVGWSVVPFLR